MDNSIYTFCQQYHADKASGIKRTPLHLLKECLEDAGINAAKYGRLVRKYGNAPKPLFVTSSKWNTTKPSKHFRKAEVLAYIKDCLEKESNA